MPTVAPFALAALVAIGLAGCVARHDAEREAAAAFAELDADRDDVVVQEEFARAFDRFDLDGDGVIEASENAALVYEADADRDGGVTPEEFRTIDLARLEADANLDGRLSRQELERFTREQRASIGPSSATRGAAGSLGRENQWLQFRF